MNKHQRSFVAHDTRSSASVEQQLVAAFQHHQRGEVLEAVTGYQAVVSVDPNQPDALHLLGVASYQLGNSDKAVDLIRRSLRVRPNNADACTNLGNALLALGKENEAESSFRKSLQLNPQNAAAHFNLANLLAKSERHPEAIGHYDQALRIQPTFVDALYNRASSLYHEERYEEALAGYLSVASQQPNWPQLYTSIGSVYARLERWDEARDMLLVALQHNDEDGLALGNLGNVLLELKQYEEAISLLQRASELLPDNLEMRYGLARAWMHKGLRKALEIARETTSRPDARAKDWYLIGSIQTSCGKDERAIESFMRAKEMDPDSVFVSNHLAASYAHEGMLEEAIAFLEEKLRRKPDDELAFNDLGGIWKDFGDTSLAVETMRQGLELRPNAICHSNLLFTLFYSDDFSAAQILEESRAWAAIHTPNVPQAPPVRDRKGGKIRIGYLSADFHAHPAGYLYEALFPLHDRSKFEIYLYMNMEFGDEVTQNISASADKWRMVRYDSDEKLTEIVREDEIDIFVDLLGHTNSNRLKVFGNRPAPVQVGWLGYFGTTGMEQMDYIICDRFTLPENEEPFYTERPARMPSCMYVFQAPKVPVQPSKPPMLKNGYVTLGCFNNTAKITPNVIALWSEVLKQMPDSKIVLNRWPFKSKRVCDRFLKLFEENSISRDRIELQATKGRQAYFEAYNEVDVMLDTFPYGGGTTTSEALWMGVPVVTLPSDRLVGHMTESIYNAVGLQELCVSTPEDFIALALSLASDSERLTHYRETLRHQIESSPLCDLQRFARDLEGQFEWMLGQAAQQ